MKAFFTLCSLLTSANHVAAYQRLDNSDFFGMDIFSVYSESPIGCVSICERVPDCRLVTWWDRFCYVKSSISNETFKQDAVSFIMYPEDLNCTNSFTWAYRNPTACSAASMDGSMDDVDSMGGSMSGSVGITTTSLPAVPELNDTVATPVPTTASTTPTTTTSAAGIYYTMTIPACALVSGLMFL